MWLPMPSRAVTGCLLMKIWSSLALPSNFAQRSGWDYSSCLTKVSASFPPVFKEPHAEYLCFPNISADKNNHQIVNAGGRYKQVLSLRMSYIMWTLVYLLIFQIYVGRQNICKCSKSQIKSPSLCIMLLGQKRNVTAHSLCDKNL